MVDVVVGEDAWRTELGNLTKPDSGKRCTGSARVEGLDGGLEGACRWRTGREGPGRRLEVGNRASRMDD